MGPVLRVLATDEMGRGETTMEGRTSGGSVTQVMYQTDWGTTRALKLRLTFDQILFPNDPAETQDPDDRPTGLQWGSDKSDPLGDLLRYNDQLMNGSGTWGPVPRW